MGITADGIALTIGLWKEAFDKIELLDITEAESTEKTPVNEEETGYLQETAFFPHDEANYHIEIVRLYAGTTLVAENSVDITKSSRQSLTVIRKDYLEEAP